MGMQVNQTPSVGFIAPSFLPISVHQRLRGLFSAFLAFSVVNWIGNSSNQRLAGELAVDEPHEAEGVGVAQGGGEEGFREILVTHRARKAQQGGGADGRMPRIARGRRRAAVV